MCNFLSLKVVRKNGGFDFYYDPFIDSHTGIDEKFGLKDLSSDHAAKLEITPPDGDIFERDVNKWEFVVDEVTKPDWVKENVESIEKRTRGILKNVIKEYILVDEDIPEIRDRKILAIKNCRIGAMLGSSIVERMYGSSVVEKMYDSSVVEAMRGSSVVKEMHDSSVVKGMHDSPVVKGMHDSSVVEEMYNSSVVKNMYDSSVVRGMYGPSVVEEMYDLSVVEIMYGPSVVRGMFGSSAVERMYGSSIAIKGGIIYTPNEEFKISNGLPK